MNTGNVTFITPMAQTKARLAAADAVAFDQDQYPDRAEICNLGGWTREPSRWSRKVHYRLDGALVIVDLVVNFDDLANIQSVEIIQTLH